MHAIEAGPILLKNGKIAIDMEKEGWKSTNSIKTQAAFDKRYCREYFTLNWQRFKSMLIVMGRDAFHKANITNAKAGTKKAYPWCRLTVPFRCVCSRDFNMTGGKE